MAHSTPLQFDVPDMDCQGCVRSITEALRKLDPNVHVVADLDTSASSLAARSMPAAPPRRSRRLGLM